MTDRLVHPDYKVTFRGESGPFEMGFEVWTNTSLRNSNFWIMFGGIEQDLDQFSELQLQQIGRYVEDWRAPGGH